MRSQVFDIFEFECGFSKADECTFECLFSKLLSLNLNAFLLKRSHKQCFKWRRGKS